MLNNDPPPGTQVKFVREVRKARIFDRATLIRPMRRYLTEAADDDFEIEFRGERMTVKRQDIEKVE
jgi:hypothetical protein